MNDMQSRLRLARAPNHRRALDYLAENGPQTRTDLANAIGISKPTALDVINRLMTADLIEQVGIEMAIKRGPSAAVFGLRRNLALAVGVYLTNSHITIERRTLSGQRMTTQNVPTNGKEMTPELIVNAINSTGIDADFNHRCVAIGLPGAVDPDTGDIIFAWDIPHWRKGLAQQISQALNCSVIFENEVNLRAHAEHRFGVAQGVDDFIEVALGGGVGAALYINGEVRRGYHGAAGEIGVLPVPGAMRGQNPADARGARRMQGGLEAVAGAAALTKVARNNGMDTAYPYWVAEAVAYPQKYQQVIREVAARISLGIISAVAVIDPKLVVLTGETAIAGGETLAQAVRDYLDGHLPWSPTVKVSSLAANSVAIGAVDVSQHYLQDFLFSASEQGGLEAISKVGQL
ncbi:ROK family transcriptional regulator [Micrococcales bacterium 31B]|nr:ROK family transcriptional regulator [Micrococcales bacterium 31B]